MTPTRKLKAAQLLSKRPSKNGGYLIIADTLIECPESGLYSQHQDDMANGSNGPHLYEGCPLTTEKLQPSDGARSVQCDTS